MYCFLVEAKQIYTYIQITETIQCTCNIYLFGGLRINATFQIEYLLLKNHTNEKNN